MGMGDGISSERNYDSMTRNEKLDYHHNRARRFRKCAFASGIVAIFCIAGCLTNSNFRHNPPTLAYEKVKTQYEVRMVQDFQKFLERTSSDSEEDTRKKSLTNLLQEEIDKRNTKIQEIENSNEIAEYRKVKEKIDSESLNLVYAGGLAFLGMIEFGIKSAGENKQSMMFDSPPL